MRSEYYRTANMRMNALALIELRPFSNEMKERRQVHGASANGRYTTPQTNGKGNRL